MKLISILGVLGVGKSTLLDSFPEEKYTRVEEPVEDNPWLEPFYAELKYLYELRKVGNLSPARTTPMMEVYLLARQKRDIEEAKKRGKIVVSDYGCPGVFARLLHKDKIISDLDYKTFKLVECVTKVIPDIVIYLRGLDFAFGNIKKRGRKCEEGLSEKYLVDLDRSYQIDLQIYRDLGVDVYCFSWPDSLELIDTILVRHRLPGITKGN